MKSLVYKECLTASGSLTWLIIWTQIVIKSKSCWDSLDFSNIWFSMWSENWSLQDKCILFCLKWSIKINKSENKWQDILASWSKIKKKSFWSIFSQKFLTTATIWLKSTFNRSISITKLLTFRFKTPILSLIWGFFDFFVGIT